MKMTVTGKLLLQILFLTLSVVAFTLVDGCVHQVSPWYNNSHPNAVNRSETEAPPNATEINKVCPSAGGGKLSIECIDSKSSNPSRYGCNVNFGGLCTAPANSTTMCPDVAIRYTCNCPTTPATPVTLGSHSRTQSTQTKQSTSGSPLMTSPSGHNGAGRASIAPSSVWHIIVLWYLWRMASVHVIAQ